MGMVSQMVDVPVCLRAGKAHVLWGCEHVAAGLLKRRTGSYELISAVCTEVLGATASLASRYSLLGRS